MNAAKNKLQLLFKLEVATKIYITTSNNDKQTKTAKVILLVSIYYFYFEPKSVHLCAYFNFFYYFKERKVRHRGEVRENV